MSHLGDSPFTNYFLSPRVGPFLNSSSNSVDEWSGDHFQSLKELPWKTYTGNLPCKTSIRDQFLRKMLLLTLVPPQWYDLSGLSILC